MLRLKRWSNYTSHEDRMHEEIDKFVNEIETSEKRFTEFYDYHIPFRRDWRENGRSALDLEVTYR